MNAFYLVWRQGGDAPTVMHSTFDTAREEAERLAEENPGKQFFVMASCGSAVAKTVHWEDHTGFPF